MIFDPGKYGKEFLYFDKNDSISESIVLQLLSCINDNKQRNLFFDGWYSSINLIEKLTKLEQSYVVILKDYILKLKCQVTIMRIKMKF